MNNNFKYLSKGARRRNILEYIMNVSLYFKKLQKEVTQWIMRTSKHKLTVKKDFYSFTNSAQYQVRQTLVL